MAKFVVLDSNNQASAFYDGVINAGSIPAGAIAISDALWQQWIDQTASVAYQASTQTLIAFTPSVPLATLQAAVVSAAAAVSAQLVGAIEPDPTHAAAFNNAAMIVAANAGAAPTSGPFVAMVSGLAANYGLSAAQFATLLCVCMVQSGALSSALTGLKVAAAAATTGAGLATALATFETAIAAVVAALNAALPAPIAAPAAISISGVNA